MFAIKFIVLFIAAAALVFCAVQLVMRIRELASCTARIQATCVSVSEVQTRDGDKGMRTDYLPVYEAVDAQGTLLRFEDRFSHSKQPRVGEEVQLRYNPDDLKAFGYAGADRKLLYALFSTIALAVIVALGAANTFFA